MERPLSTDGRSKALQDWVEAKSLQSALPELGHGHLASIGQPCIRQKVGFNYSWEESNCGTPGKYLLCKENFPEVQKCPGNGFV